MSKKINHRYFNEDYWITPHVKSGYHPQDGHGRNDYMPKATSEFLVKIFGTSGKWMEVGCAFGWVGERLVTDYGVDWCGFDISKYSIRNSPAEVFEFLNQSDGLDIDLYSNNSFDIIHSTEVAEHVHENDVRQWLGNIYYWLKPGGKLFMTICLGHNNLRGLDDIDESHQTLQPRIWWDDLFYDIGFCQDDDNNIKASLVKLSHKDFPDGINAKEYFGWHMFFWTKPGGQND